MKPTLYVIVNKGLNMTPGKLAAQVAHATVGAYRQSKPDMQMHWQSEPHQWALVLEAEDEVQLDNIGFYLESRGFTTHLVCDEGANEVRPFALTALGVELVDKDDAVVKSIFESLRSYKHPEPRKPIRLPVDDWIGIWNQYGTSMFNRRGRKQFDYMVRRHNRTRNIK